MYSVRRPIDGASSGDPLLFDLGPDLSAQLLTFSNRRSFSNNQIIYFQDDPAEHIYFVQSGHVRLSYLMEDGSAVLLAILAEGSSFGEVAIFEDGPHCDMATASGCTEVCALPLRACRTLADRHPELHRALARLVSRRYRSYVEMTRTLSLRSLQARLACALLRLAESLGTNVAHEGRVVPAIGSFVTQADLGLMSRGARGNINRILKSWREAGWIAATDRQILVLHPARLEALALEDRP
ncbi:Crp/Fnr family transcriptional regulator [Chthonobacter rhizosphaerae]|uniref:Crp/Fnr family transcriptional regulator n=1 Tax=Chthonobacter rhizosphaerae TaxID=2735553 RepID=UPI0015EEDA76|nr:Crp/Fnr family transcriptional regulator [Chthonobacter rhizosphaerae]